MADINERLAHLGTSFSHHLLGDEQEWFMELGEADRDGLSDSFVAAAEAAASERGMAGKAIVTLSRSSVEPFLKSSTRRDLREKVFKAFTARGDNGNANDNNATILEILKLREESAKLLGFPTFAAYRLEDSMAKTPEAVRGLLERVWKPARARALADRDALQELVAEEGGNFALAPWDWRYYAEKLRQRRANFDDAAIKPYLVLDHMIEAAFDCATRLFGISFSERKDIPVWHPDVRVWEVKDAAGQHKALFYGDYFARSSKRSGAWMTSLRDQQKLDGAVAPLILNVCNFSKGADGQPSLLSPDDARTLFHEFGHGLHGMLSNVTYPSLSGTSVFTDFVELPSQLYEHWQEQPQVLRQFARHYQTGEPLPDDLLKRFLAARKFNQGFATVEFVSSALIDLEFHTQPASAIAGRAGVRAPGAGKDRDAGGDFAAAPAAAIRPHLLRRSLCGGLLQLHVVGGDGRRRFRRLRGGRQHIRPRDGKTPARRHLFVGRLARSRKTPMSRSAAGSRSPTRCCAGAGCLKHQRRPDVKMTMRRWLGPLWLAGALALASSAAQAHPHVWITATSELIYAPDGAITGVRHAWTFDDMFSTYALQGIETKTKGTYSREELAPLAQTNVESLKEFGFFTFAKADGKKEKFQEPVDYFLEYKDARADAAFHPAAEDPAEDRRTLALEVFDPAFFIDFKFADKDPVRLVGAPATCQMKFQRPNDGSANAQKLGEQTFLSGDNSNYGAMFANKITVECP